MDLAKIISGLRLELQCLNTAIASIEELARVQNVVEAESFQSDLPAGGGPVTGQPAVEGAVPVKRGRGRPRKHPVLPAGGSTGAEGRS